MSGDEGFATILSVIAALITWITWYVSLSIVRNWSTGAGRNRAVLTVTPILCALALLLVLKTVASFDVVNDPVYILMYLVMGMAWVGLSRFLTPLFSLSYRFDVLERGNASATVALAGFLVGVMACFAGGNIGDGPGWWVVVACAILSTGGLLIGWMVVEKLGGCSESITVERDLASGIRLGGLLVGLGLILGRAVAGDWVSLEATIADFVVTAWPAAAVVAAAVFLERLYRPTSSRRDCPLVTCGVIPAAAYVGSAVLYVIMLGVPQ